MILIIFPFDFVMPGCDPASSLYKTKPLDSCLLASAKRTGRQARWSLSRISNRVEDKL
jgi:hypothetical protein